MNEAIACELLARASSAARRSRRSRRASAPSARGTACRAPRPWTGSSGRRARRRRPPRRRCPRRGRCGSPGARTRARRRRGSAGACRPPAPSRRGAPRSAGGRRPAWRLASDGSFARIRSSRSKSRSASTTVSVSGACASTSAPRVDDHRAPAGADAGRGLADLVGGDHEALVLDRPRAQQHLPVVARGRLGERGRDGEHRRALDGEDPRQLREAQVVADRQAEAAAVGELATRRARRPAPRARTRGTCGRRPRRRTCGSCGRPRGPRRRDRRGRWCSRRAPRPRRARRSSRRRGRCRARAPSRAPTPAPGRRAAARPPPSAPACPSTGHFSGSTTSSAPRAAAVAREAVGRLEVAVEIRR